MLILKADVDTASTSSQGASQGRHRATRVPQARVNDGQPGSLLTTASLSSRPVPGHHLRVPKLTITRRCLWQASAPGWPKTGPKVVSHQLRGYPRHVGSEGIADQ